MKGYGLLAVLIIRLQARRGQWVSVTDLAAHLDCTPAVVQAALLSMPGQGIDCVTLHPDAQHVVHAGIFGADGAPPEAMPCA